MLSTLALVLGISLRSRKAAQAEDTQAALAVLATQAADAIARRFAASRESVLVTSALAVVDEEADLASRAQDAGAEQAVRNKKWLAACHMHVRLLSDFLGLLSQLFGGVVDTHRGRPRKESSFQLQVSNMFSRSVSRLQLVSDEATPTSAGSHTLLKSILELFLLVINTEVAWSSGANEPVDHSATPCQHALMSADTTIQRVQCIDKLIKFRKLFSDILKGRVDSTIN